MHYTVLYLCILYQKHTVIMCDHMECNHYMGAVIY